MELTSSKSGKNDQLLRFDLVADHSDHHYWDKKKARNCFTNGSNKVHKKIMQEWKILDNNLPESITVRVYEKRIDLLRAVIVGAAGTPYDHGLFMFDFVFPSDYPNKPPNVYYHSFGFRINPNLYENGKVCLSLLNTWEGNMQEKWSPARSSILQVLVSIQGLVLNEKPYFNEPILAGFAGEPRYEKYALKYNESVFLMSCKTMLLLIQNNPKNFEQLVNGHFNSHGKIVLEACIAYKNGACRIGFYGRDGGRRSSKCANEVSKKFTESIDALYPKLVQACESIGLELGDLEKILEITPQSVEAERIDKGRIGLISRIRGGIKKFLGLKKKSNASA